jgi:hypothetical protein
VSSGLFAESENSSNLVAIAAADGSFFAPPNYSNDEEGVITNLTSIGLTDHYVFKEAYKRLYFHDALYFCVVTLMTVGYGDINPTTEIGRLISM